MSRYDWLTEQVRAVPRQTFFAFEPLAQSDVARMEAGFDSLPEDYLEFVREFGSAQLFRCLASPRYYMHVSAPPEPYEFPSLGRWPGGSFLALGGQVNSGPLWLWRRHEAECPRAGLFTGDPPSLRPAQAGFAEWLRQSFGACRKLYTKKDWAAVMSPAPPFTPDEQRVIEAMQRFEFRVLSVSESAVFRVEVRNGSDMELPWLTVRVGLGPGRGMGGTSLPVRGLAPGQVRVIECEGYRSIGDPREHTLIRAPLPHPEERAYYLEFSGAHEG